MCTAWALLFRDVWAYEVFPPVGPTSWPAFVMVVREWCPGRRFWALFLPWVWLHAPRPLPADDPDDPTGFGMRIFYRPDVPGGLFGFQTTDRPLALFGSAFVPGVYPDWGLTVGPAVVWTDFMWLQARLLPPRRWGPAGGR